MFNPVVHFQFGPWADLDRFCDLQAVADWAEQDRFDVLSVLKMRSNQPVQAQDQKEPRVFVYSIQCEFRQDKAQQDAGRVDRWVGWMQEVHIPDVIRSGAVSAELIRFDVKPPTFQVLYHFESAHTFAIYEREHAPRLRGDSLREFPPETGLSYRRNLGQRLARFGHPTAE